jgi:predicted lysophospholipase L1 biosynthesis ABC-type transport system permease subunit
MAPSPLACEATQSFRAQGLSSFVVQLIVGKRQTCAKLWGGAVGRNIDAIAGILHDEGAGDRLPLPLLAIALFPLKTSRRFHFPLVSFVLLAFPIGRLSPVRGCRNQFDSHFYS